MTTSTAAGYDSLYYEHTADLFHSEDSASSRALYRAIFALIRQLLQRC
jgi:hypothetical protein